MGEGFVVPEAISERPGPGLHGIGGAIQNFELQKLGVRNAAGLSLARLPAPSLRPRWRPVAKTSDPMQLAAVVQSRRLVLTAGQFSILDVFDRNTVKGDPRQSFLNMAFMTYSSWDFPSDARGYSWGGTAELYWDDSALRLGRITPRRARTSSPSISHLEVLGRSNRAGARPPAWGPTRRYPGPGLPQPRLHWQLRRCHRCARGRSGQERRQLRHALPRWLEQRHRSRPVLGAQAEREARYRGRRRADGRARIGLFFRGMYSDGRTEVDAFNPADRSVAGGVVAKGTAWGRNLDVAGLGLGASWIPAAHARYLAMGGIDGFIGDGNLRQAAEGILDVFYSARLWGPVWLSADYQLLWNPGYNANRAGPVNIPGARIPCRVLVRRGDKGSGHGLSSPACSRSRRLPSSCSPPACRRSGRRKVSRSSGFIPRRREAAGWSWMTWTCKADWGERHVSWSGMPTIPWWW